MARIKKGDTVTVQGGKDRGKTGKVLQVWPHKARALVERLNLRKNFERRTQQTPEGGVVEREAAIALSQLALVCPRCHKPSRVGWSVDGQQKQRVCHRCKTVI